MTEASAPRPAPPPPTPTPAPTQAPTPSQTPVQAAPEPPARPEPKPAPAAKPASRPAPSTAGELLQAAIDASPTMRVRMILEKLRPIALEGGVLRAEVSPDVRNLAEMSRGTIEGLLEQASGSTVRIELEASTPEAGESGAEQASENARTPGAGAGETGSAAADHPLVRRARELFDAGIVNVRPKQSGRNADR